MDRRSIFTVILLTLCFFGVNYYFDMQRAQTVIEQKKAEEAAFQAAHALTQDEITRRSAPLSSFSIVPYTAAEKNHAEHGHGYAQGSMLLTLQTQHEPPREIEFQGKTATLLSNRSGIGSPILYAVSSSQDLTVMSLPQVGVSDVHVITLDGSPQVYLGLYQDGMLSFPGNMPPENGIVFYAKGQQMYPVGYFNLTSSSFVPLSSLDSIASRVRYTPPAGAKITQSEDLFVLENEYLQLVISSIGGSLSEINLPLRGKNAPNSPVRAIGIDTTLTKKYPQNARFPEKPFLTVDNQGQKQQKDPTTGGYYPLLRRGISSTLPNQNVDAPVRYNGLNLVSEDPMLSTIRFRVTQFTNREIVLEGTYKGTKIEKRYTLPEDSDKAPYVFDCFVSVQGSRQGMWISSGVPEAELISGSFIPALKYADVKKEKIVTNQISQPKPSTDVDVTDAQWMSNGNGFFGVIVDPLSFAPTSLQAGQIPGEADPSRLSVIDAKYNAYPAKDYPGYELLMPLNDAPVQSHFRVFAGPFDTTVLKQVDAAYTNPADGVGPGYINTQAFHGWFSFISEPFAQFLLILLNLFHAVTGSWGLSIILLTFALRVMLYPLNNWSIKSMARMQEVGPKIERIREKYKKDQRRLQTEMMKVYKEEGGNPFSGCLPLLIQMPFLIGMFDLLKSSFELRGATFIPGWITNLAAPDVLFSWGYPIPFIGSSFHLLPLLLGGVMYLQQQASQRRNVRKHQALTDQQKQQQQMGKIMTLMFTVLFYKSPSGLNLYWISSMGLSALQQWYTMRNVSSEKK